MSSGGIQTGRSWPAAAWDLNRTLKDSGHMQGPFFQHFHDEDPIAPAPYKHTHTANSSGAGQMEKAHRL